MPMLSPSLRRAPHLAAALLVALAASGCAFKNPFASKNPLIDDEPEPPAAAAKAEAPAKPVLPKPVLVVKPGEENRPAGTETRTPEPKPSAQAAAPAAKPASAGAAAEAASDARPDAPSGAATPPAASNSAPAPQPGIARIADPGRPAPSGWERWLGVFKPYKINIQQGNFVSHDMAAKVRPGMTKEQVRFVLGTPLLTDMFHADRWDYLFRLQKPNGELTANRMAVFFRDNRVERIQSSELPSESEYLTHIAGPAAPAQPAATPAKPSASSPSPSTQP